MARSSEESQLVEILSKTIVDLVRSDTRDLSARQLAVLLTCYLEKENTQTVRGLTANLATPKSAISIALTRLEKMELVQRKPEPGDRRGIVVGFTSQGSTYMQRLVQVLEEASGRAVTGADQPAK